MNNLVLLKNKLITLEKDWLTLISIANNYKKNLKVYKNNIKWL